MLCLNATIRPKFMPTHYTNKHSNKYSNLSERSATFAPAALGALTARITAKIARKKPNLKTFTLIAENWSEIVPEQFRKQAKPLKLVFAKHSTLQSSRKNQKATLTIATTQGFAPIAMHQNQLLIDAINSYLNEEVVVSIRIKQQSQAI